LIQEKLSSDPERNINMKMRKLFIIFIILLLSFTITISCKKQFSGEWVAKIEGETITLDELNNMYYAQHKHLLNITKEEVDKFSTDPDLIKRMPTLNKQFYLDELIKQRLIYNKAVKEGMLDNKEIQSVIQIAKEGAVVQAYVKERFKDDIKISDEEVEALYARERNRRYKGVPIDQAERHIKQYLFSRKMQSKLIALVENLKEQSRIEKNEEALRKVMSKEEPKEEK
jgi:hypothetical protein